MINELQDVGFRIHIHLKDVIFVKDRKDVGLNLFDLKEMSPKERVFPVVFPTVGKRFWAYFMVECIEKRNDVL